MLRVEPVVPELWCDADWQRCYELHGSAHREQGGTPRSLAAYRLAHAPVPGALLKRYWVARDGLAIVGKLDFAIVDSTSGEATLALYVMPESRRRGVARALLRNMLPIAEQHKTRRVHAGAASPLNWSICERLGGQVEHTTLRQSLSLEHANWRLAQEWGQSVQRARSTRIESFESLPDELAVAFLELQQSIWAEFPQALTQANAAPTLALRREEERRHQLLGSRWLTLVTREPDATISGVTDVTYDPLQPELVRQNLTAVLPRYRGTGLAKWLKAAMLFSIRDQFPSATQLLTVNAADNPAMLEINRKLGFAGVVQQRVYGFELALLRAALGPE